MDKITEYITQGMNSIGGWLYPEDAEAMVVVNNLQAAMGITGSLVEIGVYRGKTLALMSMLARPDEWLVGIDSFVLGRASREATLDALLMVGARMERTIIETVDLYADYAPIPRSTQDAMEFARMIHIDAGHQQHQVARDLARFSQFARMDAVIVADDFFQKDHIGVPFAVVHFCEAAGWHPFLVSKNKAFLCRREYARAYLMQIAAAAEFEASSRAQMISGYPCLIAHSNIPMPWDEVKRMITK